MTWTCSICNTEDKIEECNRCEIHICGNCAIQKYVQSILGYNFTCPDCDKVEKSFELDANEILRIYNLKLELLDKRITRKCIKKKYENESTKES